MNRQEIFEQIQKKKSYLCVGLDTDIRKIPRHLLAEPDPLFAFNKQIIDATLPYTVAYKPNIAFYEAQGLAGWQSLQKTMDYLPSNVFTIADAKRGDIGNTSNLYARAFFNHSAAGFDFDSVTVAPYMGSDSVLPFLEYPNKWVILLALTSNEGSHDFQTATINQTPLYEQVISKAQEWATTDQLMFVVGATKASSLQRIRALAPDNFLLVPGVGSQGGSLAEVSKFGMNAQCGLLVNASRSIIYASTGTDFADKAGQEAKKIQQEMEGFLAKFLPAIV